MTDKLAQDVQSIVDDILKQKNDAEMIKETEEALNKSAEKINELAASLEAKDGELSVSVDKIVELEAVVAELSEKAMGFESSLAQLKKDFDTEKADIIVRAETAEAELSNLKKDMRTTVRLEELKAEGVSASGDKAIESQIAKIREMEDEVFATYKAERVELRKAIVAELEASIPTKVDTVLDDATVVEVDKEAADQVADTVKLEDELEAANSGNSIDPMKAVAAMLNMEVIPSGETAAKYKEFGKALAERVVARAKKQSK